MAREKMKLLAAYVPIEAYKKVARMAKYRGLNDSAMVRKAFGIRAGAKPGRPPKVVQ